jgi:hypothetical protein
MFAKNSARKSTRTFFSLTMVAAMLMVMFFAMIGNASAATDVKASPESGRLGATFSLKMSGFLPGERVSLWSTDPKGKAMDASYIYADENGEFNLKVQTSDPDGLTDEDEANYTALKTVYDDDGNIVEQYLEIILHQPSKGAWAITAQGNDGGNLQVGSFTVN